MAKAKRRPQHIWVYTRKAIRELDKRAIHTYGIPEQSLIENAGRAVAEAAFDFLGDPLLLHGLKRPLIYVVCGKGNNGADGYAAARHLSNMGFPVCVMPVHRPDPGSPAALQFAICRKKIVLIQRSLYEGASLIIDALYGTGLTRPLTAPDIRLIERINNHKAPVLSIDIPSGLDADTGNPLGACVRANLTVTFVGPKIGTLTPIGASYCGDMIIADIGTPAILRRMGELITLPC